MKEEKINIKVFKADHNTHEIFIYTDKGGFIASSHMKEVNYSPQIKQV